MTAHQQTLSITPQEDKELSAEQQTFNRLTARIEQLVEEGKSARERLDSIFLHYSKSLQPIDQEIAKQQLGIAILLHKGAGRYKFTNIQKRTFKNVILYLFSNAFQSIIPNEEEEVIYNYWAHVSYKEAIQMSDEDRRDYLSEMMKQKYGVDIELTDYDDSPEGFAQYQEKLQEELEKKIAKEANQNAKKKKTKKQLERDATQKEAAALQLKNIRSIYIALAKVLHPDAHNELDKTEKEELMKKVTKAYAEKDLSTLLQLEMEWVNTDHNHINTLGTDKLKLYITNLKQRIKQLEAEQYKLYSDPQYRSIGRWAQVSQKSAIRDINKIKKQLDEAMKHQKDSFHRLSNNMTKKSILDFALTIEDQANLNYYDEYNDGMGKW